MIKNYIIIIAFVSSLFYTGCLQSKPKRPSSEDILRMQAALPVEVEEEPKLIVEIIPELTPLQKCEKEENKFNRSEERRVGKECRL